MVSQEYNNMNTDNIQYYILMLIQGTLSLTCIKRDSCSCQMSDGSGLVDLHKISHRDNTALYVNIADPSNNEYTFNPCYGFTIPEYRELNDAALYRYTNKDNMSESGDRSGQLLGVQQDASFIVQQDGVVVLQFIRDNIVSNIHLTCSLTEESFHANGKTGVNVFKFILKSRCACPGECEFRLSPGSIILIVFSSLVAAYFIVGILYRKSVYGASGCDLIPHRQFWSDLPCLIKDGYLFFISPCLGNRVEYRHYERL